MSGKRFVSGGVIAALLAAFAPTSWSAEKETSAPSLRAAADRAVARAAPGREFRSGKMAGRRFAATQAPGAGGGGRGAGTVLMLLTTAAGIAGTYFLVKEMQRQNQQSQQTQP